MSTPLLKKLHKIYLETKTVELPPELLPAPSGFNLIAWARELYDYYREESLIVRPFDDLPPFRLSQEEHISTRIQDVHAFIINDLNMIPMKTRQTVIGMALEHDNTARAWDSIADILLESITTLDCDEAQAELSWTCSPVCELLWALSWFFIAIENIQPPKTTRMHSTRFPYYCWVKEDGSAGMWEPEEPLCRPAWLAMDMLRRRMEMKA